MARNARVLDVGKRLAFLYDGIAMTNATSEYPNPNLALAGLQEAFFSQAQILPSSADLNSLHQLHRHTSLSIMRFSFHLLQIGRGQPTLPLN